MIKNFKLKNIFFYFFFLILFLSINLFSQEIYCLNSKFLPVPSNSIDCYVKVSKKTQDELSATKDLAEREKKYFNSEDFKEHLEQRKKIEKESLELKNKEKSKVDDWSVKQREEIDRKRKEDCEKRNNDTYDVNSSARQVCLFDPNIKDKKICYQKFPPRYEQKKWTSRKENCY